jgi:hypothetical protein
MSDQLQVPAALASGEEPPPPPYSVSGKVGGRYSLSEHGSEGENTCPCWNQPSVIQPIDASQVTD